MRALYGLVGLAWGATIAMASGYSPQGLVAGALAFALISVTLLVIERRFPDLF